ncbi:MAG: Uma2 family endonuclease [Geitlerinemataceae cyanobacterium]
MLANDPIYIHPDEYLASELASPVRHEYRGGEVFAMSGGTRAHSIITGNLFGNLWMHLRGSGCRAFSENMKVRVAAANSFYYSDIAVTCDDRDSDGQSKQHYIEHPKLIIEVLSPSTAAFDRMEKFADYRTLGSLEEYVLVSAERMEVEVFRRGSGAWTRQVYGENSEASVQLGCVDLALALGEVYEDTSLAI